MVTAARGPPGPNSSSVSGLAGDRFVLPALQPLLLLLLPLVTNHQ